MRKVLLIFALALVFAAPAMAKDIKVNACIVRQGGLPYVEYNGEEIHFKGESYGPAFKDAEQGMEICGCPSELEQDARCEMELVVEKEQTPILPMKVWVVQKIKRYKKR